MRFFDCQIIIKRLRPIQGVPIPSPVSFIKID